MHDSIAFITFRLCIMILSINSFTNSILSLVVRFHIVCYYLHINSLLIKDKSPDESLIKFQTIKGESMLQYPPKRKAMRSLV